MENFIGCTVNIKNVYRNENDPPSGIILASYPTKKIKVLWSNGKVSVHDRNSPYMFRYDIASSILTA